MKISILARQYELKYKLGMIADNPLDSSKINPNAIKACQMLKKSGFEAYLVGGCVRDLLMGKSPKDWDLTTNATPNQVKIIFPKHFALGEKHGTITVVLGPTEADRFEITTYRTEGNYSDGRRPDSVEFADNIEDDLSRRDLTINAMAFDPIKKQLIDPYGGQADLNAKIIKAVGDPNKRFQEDGLRTMRVARFAARFGFNVDHETQEAISNHLGTLKMVSKERFSSELLAILMTSKPSVGLNILYKTGAFGVGDPSLDNSSIADSFHIIDNNSDASLEVKVAILLHTLSSEELTKTLKNLKFGSQKIEVILFLNIAMQEFANFSNDSSPHGARKFFSFIKSQCAKYPVLGGYDKCLSEFLSFAKALGAPALSELRMLMNEVPLTIKDMDISGDDLKAKLNMKPGREIKEILDKLYAAVLSDPGMNEKSKLLELATEFEKMAINSLKSMITKNGSGSDWWRLSKEEETELLLKEFNFGNGLIFQAGDIPEIAGQVEVPAGPVEHHPEKNQLFHNNLVFDQAKKLSNDPMVWYAALLHDLGKLYTDKAIWPKQHGHEAGGVLYVEKVSDMLGVPARWKEFAKLVALNHLKCHRSEEMTQRGLRKLFESFNGDKSLFDSFLTACEADAKGRLGGHAVKPYKQKDHLSEQWNQQGQNKNTASSLAISGDALIRELGLKPGPTLGKILKTIREMVDADPMLNDYKTLLGISSNLLIKEKSLFQ